MRCTVRRRRQSGQIAPSKSRHQFQRSFNRGDRHRATPKPRPAPSGRPRKRSPGGTRGRHAPERRPGRTLARTSDRPAARMSWCTRIADHRAPGGGEPGHGDPRSRSRSLRPLRLDPAAGSAKIAVPTEKGSRRARGRQHWRRVRASCPLRKAKKYASPPVFGRAETT